MGCVREVSIAKTMEKLGKMRIGRRWKINSFGVGDYYASFEIFLENARMLKPPLYRLFSGAIICIIAPFGVIVRFCWCLMKKIFGEARIKLSYKNFSLIELLAFS